jgi:hypothetical protein
MTAMQLIIVEEYSQRVRAHLEEAANHLANLRAMLARLPALTYQRGRRCPALVTPDEVVL